MKDRRERLKRLALANLADTEARTLGLLSEPVLDSLAPQVIRILQGRGVHIPEALVATRDGPLSSMMSNEPLSIYQAVGLPHDAELFYRAGFHDTDSWCNTNAAELENIHNARQDLPYLHWLAIHGGMSWPLEYLGSTATARHIYTAHYAFWRIGHELQRTSASYLRHDLVEVSFAGSEWSSLPPPEARRAWVLELQAAAMPSNYADSCRCRCSEGGCTALISMMKGTTKEPFQRYNTPAGVKGCLLELIRVAVEYFLLFGEGLDIRHHIAVIRYFTFTAIGIPHICCDPEQHFLWDSWDNEDFKHRKNATEFQDKHAHELALLEELLSEFEPQIRATIRLSDPRQLVNFWTITWTNRMGQGLVQLEGGDLGGDERWKVGEIGPRAPDAAGNPYEGGTLDYWMYELEKVEAE